MASASVYGRSSTSAPSGSVAYGSPYSSKYENVMVFVALHEMGHVITSPSVASHGPEFWNNFGWLLREAEALGIYKYQDFKAHPVTYCGEKITDQPKYDENKDVDDVEVGNPLKIGSVTR